MIESNGPALPSPQQVAALRSFIDGRTYIAVGATIRLPDDPPLTPGSGLARAKEVSSAFFGLVARIAGLLQAELKTDSSGDVAVVLWDLLLHSARPWATESEVPDDLREVLIAAAEDVSSRPSTGQRCC